MGLFNQRRDTVEWLEYRDDVLFYKWRNNEIKRGSRLIIRAGQKAIFYAGGKIEGVFENEGTFDIAGEIVPFLSTLSGWFELRKDTGLRTEIYFVNSKELLLNWGTRQRIMIPTTEVPSGIPVGMHGNLVIKFRDYLTFIERIAGIKSSYTLDDVAERIRGELDGIIAAAILNGQQSVGLNALVSLQANNRAISEGIKTELDKEMFNIGLAVEDVNIISINYPEEVQRMAEKVAGQSFVTDAAKYATIAAADGMANGDSGVAGLGAQMAIGAQIAAQMNGSAPAAAPAGDRFCPKCRKLVSGKYCNDCGTETV